MKSFRPKGSSDEGPGNGPGEPSQPWRNGEVDFRKTRRSNETHASTMDKDARLYRKGAGQESRLCYLGHTLMENRNGLAAVAEATLATGTAEREAVARMSQRLPQGATLGAAINGTVSKHGKALKTAVPPQVAASLRYAISQRLRKRIEEGFGWTKTVGGLMQVKVRGLANVRAAFVFAMAAYNIVACQSLWPQGANCVRRHEKPENNDPTSRQNLEREPRPPAKNRACTPRCANAVTFSAA